MKKIIVMSMVASLTFAAQLTSDASINLEQTNNELHMVLDSDQSVYGIQFDVKYDANKINVFTTSAKMVRCFRMNQNVQAMF